MPAKRAYGMDQEFYSWSPIVTRPVLRWPDNARVALAVIVNLEHWDWEVPAGTPLSEVGEPSAARILPNLLAITYSWRWPFTARAISSSL